MHAPSCARMPILDQNEKYRAAAWALACVAVCLLWQGTLVHFKFDGNWNGLYLTGDTHAVPELLAGENIYQAENSNGYDGQFYHYMSHDPFLTRGLQSAVDAPELRWRRILVPGAAAAISLGNDAWTDVAYRAVILVFVFLGCYWLGCIAAYFGRSPAWGPSFMLIPPMAFALDRMTVDIALVALCVGYLLFTLENRSKAVWAVLVLAPLARETGLALIAVHAGISILRRRWSDVLRSLACTAPFIAWAVFVRIHTEQTAHLGSWTAAPLQGLVVRTVSLLDQWPPETTHMLEKILAALCIFAVWSALVASFALIWRRLSAGGRESLGAVEVGVIVFSLAAVALGAPAAWAEPHAFVRILSPLFVFLLIAGLRDGSRALLLPAVLLLPWLATETAVQAVFVWRNF